MQTTKQWKSCLFLLTNISCYHSILENKVNTICEKVRTVLMQREQKKYIQAILSTYVRSTPTDLESALRLLAELKGKHGQFLQRRVFQFLCKFRGAHSFFFQRRISGMLRKL
jgi:hypothetical protein